MLERVTEFRREATMGYDNQTDHGQWGQSEVLWTAHDAGDRVVRGKVARLYVPRKWF